MMTTSTPSVSIQIYGGNNQILPNATYAVQNFYGDELASQNTAGESSSPAPLSPPEQRLSIYINNVDTLRGYLTQLQACKTAKEVGEVVATMCLQETTIVEELIVKQNFITLLLPFLTNVETGKSIDNLRLYINQAWEVRKRANRHPGR